MLQTDAFAWLPKEYSQSPLTFIRLGFIHASTWVELQHFSTNISIDFQLFLLLTFHSALRLLTNNLEYSNQ